MAAPQAWAPGRRRDLPLVRASPGIGPIVIILGLAVVPIGLAVTLDGSTYDTWGAFVWGPVLLALAFPLCRWVAKRTGEPEIAGFLFGAAALKIVVGAVARYYMVDSVYGVGDAVRYDEAGGLLAEPFRRGVFADLGQVTGTRFIELVSGVVEAIIGQTMVGSFLVFSALGFVGMCLLYLAFCEALPNGDRTLYRRLLFLTPTLWFWPSSIGKEAFLMLCIGAGAYGFARLLNGHLLGLLTAGLGLWGAAVVRPHIALMIVMGGLAAIPSSPLRRPDDDAPGSPGRSFVRFVLPLVVVIAVLPPLLGAVEQFFNIDNLNVTSANEIRDEVARRSSEAGAELNPPDVSNPIGLTKGLITVTARPFPWEASGLQALASLESVALGCILAVAVARRRFGLLRALGQRWPRFALVYMLAFAWGFSAVANFGILARQRSLMLPLLFVLVAGARRQVLPAVPSLRQPHSGAHARPASVWATPPRS